MPTLLEVKHYLKCGVVGWPLRWSHTLRAAECGATRLQWPALCCTSKIVYGRAAAASDDPDSSLQRTRIQCSRLRHHHIQSVIMDRPLRVVRCLRRAEPTIRHQLQQNTRRWASTSSEPDIETSSFLTSTDSASNTSSFDPIERSRSRKVQLPPSRYRLTRPL